MAYGERVMITPKRFTATVVSNTRESSKVYVIKFRVDHGTWHFEAGQYASFILGPTIRRSLSFANPPNGNEFEICVDVTPMGPISQWIVRAKPGDSIEGIGPMGRFTVTSDSKKKIFVATGTGIGPIRSMVHDQLRRFQDELWLYWGLRFEEDVFWDKEFKALIKTHPNFHYTLTLSKPSEKWLGADGRVTEHLYNHGKTLPGFDFYLCGSREMVRDVAGQLSKRNVPEQQIKTELFY